MSVAERIKTIRGNMSQADFAAHVNLNVNTLRNYERGDSLPNIQVAAQICKEFGVCSDWLLFGNGPMYDAERVTVEGARAGMLRAGDPIARVVVKPEAAQPQATTHCEHGNQIIECEDCQITMLPMVEARLSAGTGSFETSANIERRYAFRTDFLMRKGQPSKMVLMRVAGDSMEPEVKHNDVVLIDQSQRNVRAGLMYAVGIEDMVYLKLINATPGKLVMTSHNPAYPPIEVDARGDLMNGIRIIGRAVWVGRELN